MRSAGADREGGVGETCGGVHDREIGQVAVHDDRQAARVAEGRHAADGVAGRLARLVAVARRTSLAPSAAARRCGSSRLLPGHQHEDRLAVGDEDERLHDLGDLAADGTRRVGRRPRPRRESLRPIVDPAAAAAAVTRSRLGCRRRPASVWLMAADDRTSATLAGTTQERQGSAQALRVRKAADPRT